MNKFIELRFGQGDLGRSMGLHKNDVEEGEYFVQREIVPVEAIKDVYVILPEKRNIKVKFEVDGHLYSRTEYYKNVVDCLKRWTFIKKALVGLNTHELLASPVPLAMDVEDMPQKEKKDGTLKEVE